MAYQDHPPGVYQRLYPADALPRARHDLKAS